MRLVMCGWLAYWLAGWLMWIHAALAAGDPTFYPSNYVSLALQQAFSLTGMLKTLVNFGSQVLGWDGMR